MTRNIEGVLTALVTPFDRDEEVDADALRRVVDRSIDAGVDGVVVGGSTGEFFALDPDERRRVVDIVAEHAAGRAAVVAQTGATTVREAVRHSATAQAAGVDAVMLVSPFYEPLALDATIGYFEEVAASVDLPVVLYNYPEATGLSLDLDTIAGLAARVPNIRYVKDSSGDWDLSLKLIHHLGDRVGTFVGWDAFAFGALVEGAAGVMTGVANVIPDEIVHVARLLRAGDDAAALTAWRELYPVVDTIISNPFVSAVKASLRLRGVDVGVPRRPAAALAPGRLDHIRTVLRHLPKGTPMTTADPTVRRADDGAPLVAADELPPLTHFIDGAFVASESGATLPVVDPATEETIAEIAAGTAADVDAAVAAATRAAGSWRRTTPKERATLLLTIADRIEEHADRLSRLESLNCGKPRMVSDDDIANSADVFRFAAGAGRAFTELGSADYVEDHTSIILREPVGVVGAIVPWNYPLLMAAWKLAPILAAGNTVVLKPSEQTPLTILALAEIIADVLPAGVFNLVLGTGDEVGARLAESPDVDLVALTGSVRAGKSVATAAGDSLKRVHLELGGKAPVVIFADADLAAAAESLRVAGYWNSGQECGAGTRVLVHESVADEFVRLLVEQVSSFAIGAPDAGEDIEIGPLISKAHYDRVLGFLARATEAGARAAIGGGALDGAGYFVAPTVLVDVQPGSEASREEIFGPVVTVETFTDEDEALRRANDVEYGLASSVWTSDAARSLALPRDLDFGTVWVNCHLVLSNEVPWGGFKGSGYGRDLSVYALNDFSRTKHVQINHGR